MFRLWLWLGLRMALLRGGQLGLSDRCAIAVLVAALALGARLCHAFAPARDLAGRTGERTDTLRFAPERVEKLGAGPIRRVKLRVSREVLHAARSLLVVPFPINRAGEAADALQLLLDGAHERASRESGNGRA